MRMVIIGCGRVGSRIANVLDGEGHHVVIIDRDPAAFDALRPSFAGERIVGFAFDRHTLQQAGLEKSDAFVAATRGDNRNIVAALAAKRRFRVPKVVARIYDPDRAEIYRGQGILTISPVRWSVNRLRDMLLHPTIEQEQEFGNGEVVVIRLEVPPMLVGKRIADVTVPGDITVLVIIRKGRAILPTLGMSFEEGDEVRFVVAREAYGRFESFVGVRA